MLVVRPLRAGDDAAAHALLAGEARGTPYMARLLEILEQALTGGDDEARGLVVERDGAIVALAVYGAVAGAVGAGKVHFLVGRAGDDAQDAATSLLRALEARAASAGARFLIAELPDDPAVAGLVAPLRRHGFHDVARVADFFSDGVDLLFLRLRLGARPA